MKKLPLKSIRIPYKDLLLHLSNYWLVYLPPSLHSCSLPLSLPLKQGCGVSAFFRRKGCSWRPCEVQATRRFFICYFTPLQKVFNEATAYIKGAIDTIIRLSVEEIIFKKKFRGLKPLREGWTLGSENLCFNSVEPLCHRNSYHACSLVGRIGACPPVRAVSWGIQTILPCCWSACVCCYCPKSVGYMQFVRCGLLGSLQAAECQ